MANSVMKLQCIQFVQKKNKIKV